MSKLKAVLNSNLVRRGVVVMITLAISVGAPAVALATHGTTM